MGSRMDRKSSKLSPGPLIGEVIDGLEEAQAVGTIKNKKEAFGLAANIIKRKK